MTPQNTEPSSNNLAASAALRRPGPLSPSASQRPLASCRACLCSGGLVLLPTEMLYGLGCHALDADAVAGVFCTKERPLSNSLIVHATDVDDVLRLWSLLLLLGAPRGDGRRGRGQGRQKRRRQWQQDDDKSNVSIKRQALRALTLAFWPVPLTVVARASPSILPVTASTSYVACRSQSHPAAWAVIDAAGILIAAPLASKLGHISPTRAEHVLDDLGGEDVWVVNPELADDGAAAANGDSTSSAAAASAAKVGGGGGQICHVVIKSTVAKVKIDPPFSTSPACRQGSVVILWHGTVSESDVHQALSAAGLSSRFDVRFLCWSTPNHVANVVPGQTMRHYSLNVVSYMIAHSRYDGGCGDGGGGGGGVEDVSDEERALLSRAVVIDFGQKLLPLRRHALAYRNLSSSGNSTEAAACIFKFLQWAEDLKGAKRVYFPEVIVLEGSHDGEGGTTWRRMPLPRPSRISS